MPVIKLMLKKQLSALGQVTPNNRPVLLTSVTVTVSVRSLIWKVGETAAAVPLHGKRKHNTAEPASVVTKVIFLT